MAPLIGLTQPAEMILFAAVTAGFALLPDLDCDSSRASLLLGWFSGWISDKLKALSAWTYRHTKGPRDEDCKGTHRHLTHTVVFALVLGGLVTAGGAWIGPWFVFAVVVLGLLLTWDALGEWVVVGAAVSGLVLFFSTDLTSAIAAIGGWVGIAVTLGCITHCLGDAMTLSGCPFLWPIPMAGETWFEIRPPRMLRFRTGGKFEQYGVMPATLVGVFLLCPLVGPWVLGLLGDLAA